MTAKSKLRGHEIEYKNNQWVYSETGEPTKFKYSEKPCGNCNKQYTKEGHDACLGTLKGIMNACCGHGKETRAYVQFLDGFSIHGEDASVVLNILKKYKD